MRAARTVKCNVSDAAGAMSSSERAVLSLSRLWNVDSDGDEVTSAGRLFHTRAAATGNARSPTVDRHVAGTTIVLVDAERRRRRASRSATRWSQLLDE